MTLIELGEVSSGSQPEGPATRPRRSDVRRIAVLVVAVLCVLTVTGSERPDPRGLPVLWSMPYNGTHFTMTGDTLYVLGPEGIPDVTAYDAADGSLRWTRTAYGSGTWLNTEVPGVLLMPITVEQWAREDVGENFIQQTVKATVALDPRTGAEVWRRAGEANLWTGDMVMLVEWDEDFSVPTGFRALHGRTGRTAWMFDPAEGVTSWTTTGTDRLRPDRLITATDTGAVEVRRFDDGSVVTARKLPWRSSADGEGGFAQLFSSHDQLLVISEDAGRQTVTGYDPDTLRSLWTNQTSTFYGFFDCGALLCVSNGPGEVHALDPATGRVVWRSEGWDFALPMLDGRLVADLREGGGWHGVIDTATGRKVAEFGPGTTHIDQITGTVLTVGTASDPLGETTVTQLTGTDEIVMRGSLGLITGNGCQLAADRLACAIGAGRLSVRDVG
jgi:outer membrane protein assembly factor BamB